MKNLLSTTATVRRRSLVPIANEKGQEPYRRRAKVRRTPRPKEGSTTTSDSAARTRCAYALGHCSP